ncbi:unnamed protein product [Soboliphyme baturini]|uniref:Peptidase_M14 domain-containing protein n=1 Tax=Soboliphyme baturini TaxID=241478 RepID=A0A183J7N4_9BILA|nr:unnamed protein product [Soboliphyme baturini]
MSPSKCKNGFCCKGVDLNRNFDFHFGGLGGSSDPCEEIFQGDYPFSEPESQAVKKFLLDHFNIEAFINLHTYSQLWIHPYGHTKHAYPADVKDLVRTATKAAEELSRMYGTKYRVGSGADTLYPASGGMADWVKKNLPAKYVYLIELRPSEEVADGFILKPSQILPTAVETWQGIKTVAMAVLKKNRLA